MDACQGATLDQLPLEILHVICCNLDILGILRLRRVSRYLNQVSYSRDIWSDAYRKADFIRPPGPFLSQSAYDLETLLTPCFRVARNLRDNGQRTHTEIPTHKLMEICYKGVDKEVALALGRFLFIAFSNEVRCYDLNRSDLGPSIVHRTTSGRIDSFHCVSAFDVGGHPFACVVLNEVGVKTRRISIYLVSVGEQSKATLVLLDRIEHSSFKVNIVNLGPRVIVIHDFHGKDLIALDVHTRTRFILPSFADVMRETDEISMFAPFQGNIFLRSISTSTHLLLAKSFERPVSRAFTFFQAFGLPLADTYRRSTSGSTSICLRPSHSSVIPYIYLLDTVLLRDSILDPTTQDISIRIQAYDQPPLHNRILKHGVLCLSSASASNDQRPRTITFQFLGPVGECQPTILHPSFHSAGRAFSPYILSESSLTISAKEYDGTRDMEYHFVLHSQTRYWLRDYDPYFGRLCIHSRKSGANVIKVLDLGV